MAVRPATAIAIAIHDASKPPAEAPEPVFGSAVPAPVLPAGRVATAAGCVGFAVFVGNGVFVGDGVTVGVQVGVAVMVGVKVGVAVDVAVAVDVGVAVDVDVDVAVAVDVDVGVDVLVAVGVFVTVAVSVTVAVLVDVLVGTGVLVTVAVAVGVRPVQSAKATPRPPGNITRAAQAIDSASTRLTDFNMDGGSSSFWWREGAPALPTQRIIPTGAEARHWELY